MKKLFLMMLTLVMSITTWAAEPYFEVLSGSFATKDAEVKVTFPGVTTVELKDNLVIYDGSTYITAIFEGDYSVNGNVITFTMNPSGYYMNEPSNDPLTIELYFMNTNLFDKDNTSVLGGGVAFQKYTGSRGKSGSNDANAEYIAHLRAILDKEKNSGIAYNDQIANQEEIKKRNRKPCCGFPQIRK